MPEPCDEYLITDLANNSDHSGGNNTNKSSSDDDVIGARFNWLMMGEDKDLTTMDEKALGFGNPPSAKILGNKVPVIGYGGGDQGRGYGGGDQGCIRQPSDRFWVTFLVGEGDHPVVVSGSPSWLVAFCWGRLGKAVVEFYIQRSWSPPYHFVWSPPYHFVALKFAEISSLG
nr:hypothetical protein Iba_chr03aCG7060 [Ipomoea batatas]